MRKNTSEVRLLLNKNKKFYNIAKMLREQKFTQMLKIFQSNDIQR